MPDDAGFTHIAPQRLTRTIQAELAQPTAALEGVPCAFAVWRAGSGSQALVFGR